MSVILLKAAHSREASESTRELIAMEHTKVRNTQRQLAVRSNAVRKHQTVAGAIHRLHTELLTLDIEAEHVILVV